MPLRKFLFNGILFYKNLIFFQIQDGQFRLNKEILINQPSSPDIIDRYTCNRNLYMNSPSTANQTSQLLNQASMLGNHGLNQASHELTEPVW